MFFQRDLSLSPAFSPFFYLSLVDDDQSVRRQLGLGRLDERADCGDLCVRKVVVGRRERESLMGFDQWR